MDDEQARQEAFWIAMLDEYEQRNRLETMESDTALAFINGMSKTGEVQVNTVQFTSQIGRPGMTVTNASLISNCPCVPCDTAISLIQQPLPSPNLQRSSSYKSCSCDPGSSKQNASDFGKSTCTPAAAATIDSACECECSPCLTQDGDQFSIFSIQSSDLLFMNRLQELAEKERKMKRQIREMELREQAYIDTLRKAEEMWACVEGKYKQQMSDVQQNGDCMRKKYENMNEQLMEENARLADELKDVNLEIKQCMERLQGPVSRQLDKEKRKCQQLETEIMCATQNIANKESSYKRTLEEMQDKINCTCDKLCELTTTNEQLKQEICMLQCRYNDLQQELISQKLSEAQTLKRLNETLAMNQPECDCRRV